MPPARTLDEANARILELEQQLELARQAVGRVAELDQQLAQALQVVATLEAKVKELEARLKQNSSNSSKPPSSDPPWQVRKRGEPGAQRPRGGQPGHKGHKRTLLPPERVSATHDLKPPKCRRCGHALAGNDPTPLQHQVIDIPQVAAQAVEYRLHALECPCCHTKTRASLPAGVPWGTFGPRLQAFITMCAGAYRLSHRMIVQLVKDVFDVDVALGTISGLEAEASAAVAAPVDEAGAQVPQAGIVHADETSWLRRRLSSDPSSPPRLIHSVLVLDRARRCGAAS